MVAFTPNRLYPYSTPTDPADVPAAIEALATAVDTDIENLYNSVIPRPFACVSYSSPVGEYQTFPANVDTLAEFNFVDADNAGISDLSAEPTRLTPTSPGLWAVHCAVGVPAGASTLGTSLRSLFLRVNGADLTRSAYTAQDPNGLVTGMTLAAVAFMDGNDDYFTMTFNPVNALDDLKIRLLRMSCFRLTTS